MMYDLQKASMWKRISAFLFDFILLISLVVGVATIVSLAVGYSAYNERLESLYEKYEAEYGIAFEEYDSLSKEQSENYEAAYRALIEDDEVIYTYNMVVNLTLVIVTVSILIGFLSLEFAVPLLFGNGQTLGKKIFGIALMRTDGVRINAVSLFVRTLLGKYTIETMIPVLIIIMIYFNSIGVIGAAILLLLLALELVLLAATRTNSLIHDLFANTVAVDMASQRIFDSEEAMIEYKKKQHLEKASRSDY